MLSPDEESVATDIMQTMLDHFKTGTDRINSDFVLRTMATVLAGMVRNCGKSRKQFLNFMAHAWDEHAVVLRKIERNPQ